jgi:hypothetical protein
MAWASNGPNSAVEWLIRFLIGGTMVSAFALLGDIVRPKSFAGIFGAAPSVALATLTLTLRSEGIHYAATEARSMIIGAVAFIIYAAVCTRIMWKSSLSVKIVTLAGLAVWLLSALAGWALFLREGP